jgi:hypothetical protein
VMPITSTAACHGPVPWTSRGRSGAGLGDTLDAVPAQAWPGRIVIAKPNLCAGGQRNVSHGGRGLSHGWELNRLGRAPLQIDPEEVPTRAGRLKAATSRAMPSTPEGRARTGVANV